MSFRKEIYNLQARKDIYIIQDSLFAKRELVLFDFIYPHNLYLFSGVPQIYVAADKNKINNPVVQIGHAMRPASAMSTLHHEHCSSS